MSPEDAILAMLERRGPGKTFCPSEAAQLIDPDRWRDHMDAIRAAGTALWGARRLAVTQKGTHIDPRDARGAIRYGHPHGD